MRILIIEDEIKAAEYLKKGLTNSGYQVETSNDGIDGLFIAQSSDFDLLILDVMLPGIDGWSFIRRFRERSQAPVLFLTARDAVEDRVKGLELGADDYQSFWHGCAPCCAERRYANKTLSSWPIWR